LKMLRVRERTRISVFENAAFKDGN